MTVFGSTAHLEAEAWVEAFHRELRTTGRLGLADLAQPAPHPHLDLVAVAATVRDEPDGAARRTVLLVDPDGDPRPVLAPGALHSPTWSPDGLRLCVLGSHAFAVDVAGRVRHRSPDLGGTPESARWSPAGDRLALVVADPGAERSDVHGSGRSGIDPRTSWRPHLAPEAGGRRRLVLWEPGGDLVEPTTLTVWEADWLGRRLVALVSEDAGEDAWYAARAVVLDTDGAVGPLHAGEHQLARPTGSPDGAHWALLSGLASDRDLLAGSLVVGAVDRPGEVVATAEVHVTDLRWADADHLLVIGHRGLETVVGCVDVRTRGWTELWSGWETSGAHQAELGGLDGHGRPVLVLESPTSPPCLVRLAEDGTRDVLLDAAGPGTDALLALGVETRTLTWTAPDGWVVQGLLDLPPHPGPHPLVVHVHGGPVALHRPGWPGRDAHTTTLLARGFAVLRPNPRGSVGRGGAFAHAVVGDMGGADVDDVLAGVDRLVAEGVADPARLGLLGQSYGGFLTCWIPVLTDRFGAGVARSPCTDWVSLHLTSNIAGFARRFLTGAVHDPSSQYTTRSPLARRADLRTPLLLTAGALDLATPDSQARQLHRALRDEGVDSALAVYPEEGHGVEGAAALADQCARTVAWFEHFLPPGGDDDATPLVPTAVSPPTPR